MAERMCKRSVKHFVHQHELKLVIINLVHKIRIECYSIAIRIGGFAGKVKGKLHIH